MAVTAFVVDVETDGPNLATHSMFWFGAVVLTESLRETIEGRMCPIHDTYIPKALAVSGKTRAEIETWEHPRLVMPRFITWIQEHTRPNTTPRIWSDNTSYDLMWLTLYINQFAQLDSPLGHYANNITDQYRGLIAGYKASGTKIPKEINRSFTALRKTPHDHNPVNDAVGNAEALLALRSFGLQVAVQG